MPTIVILAFCGAWCSFWSQSCSYVFLHAILLILKQGLRSIPSRGLLPCHQLLTDEAHLNHLVFSHLITSSWNILEREQIMRSILPITEPESWEWSIQHDQEGQFAQSHIKWIPTTSNIHSVGKWICISLAGNVLMVTVNASKERKLYKIILT